MVIKKLLGFRVEGLGFRVCRRVAHERKYLATVYFRVRRLLTIGRWSLIVDGSFLLTLPPHAV